MKVKTNKTKKITAVKKKRALKPQAGKISRGMIIGIAAAVIVIGGGAFFFLNQSGTGSSPLAGIVKTPLNPNCEKNDPELCKFLNNWQTPRDFTINSATKDKEGTTMETTYEISGDKTHMVGKTAGKDMMEMITIDKTTYQKDYTDNKWWKQTYDPEKDFSKEIFDKDKFENVDEVTEVKDKTQYKSMGKEQCGDLNCFKYEVINPDMTGYTEYIWFDDKDYLIRKQTSADTEGTTTESTFTYSAISISEPSPVKEGTSEAIYGLPEMSAEDKAQYEKMMKEFESSKEMPVEDDAANQY